MTYNLQSAKQVVNRFHQLAQPSNVCLVSYIWIDSTGQSLRFKTRSIDYEPLSHKDLPWWDCAEAFTQLTLNTDVFLEPVKLFKDPFYSGNNKLVLCETYNFDRSLTAENKRHSCVETFTKLNNKKPLFIIEQKYKMFCKDIIKPLDQIDETQRADQVSSNAADTTSSSSYCSIGSKNRADFRNLAYTHYKACLYSGVNIKSYQNETFDQWSFEIGDDEGIDASDNLWIARFLLHRLAEDFDIVIKYDDEAMLANNISLYSKVYITTNEIKNEELIMGTNSLIDKSNEQKVMCRSTLTNSGFTISKHLNGFLELKRPYSNSDPYELIASVVEDFILNSLKNK